MDRGMTIITQPTSNTAPVATETPAPAAPVTAIEPVAPAPTSAPDSSAPVVSETVVSAPATTEPVKPADNTVLGDAFSPDTKPEVKPAEDAKPAPGTEEVKEGQSAEPATPPAYENWTIPDGVTVDDARLSEFTTMLGTFELTTKADHAEVQKFGQNLVDYHVSEMKGLAEKVAADVSKLHETRDAQQRQTWLDSFINDQEIGGNQRETTLSSALRFIRLYGGTPEQQAEIAQVMNQTGAGNNPNLIRLLANAGKATTEGRPIPAKAPAPQSRSKVETMYSGKT